MARFAVENCSRKNRETSELVKLVRTNETNGIGSWGLDNYSSDNTQTDCEIIDQLLC